MARHQFEVQLVERDRCDTCTGWLTDFNGVWKHGTILLCQAHSDELDATPREVTALLATA